MLSHAFSTPIANATGTVTVWDGATTASAIATEMVRPSNWNEPHIGVSTFAGNTLGASTWSGTNLILAAVTNLTLSYAANAVSIVGPDLSPYLTTAAQSNHSHGNPTLALTNISGTTASNSAGLTLSLSAGAGGAGDGGIFLSAAGSSQTAGNLVLSNSNGVSFGMNGSTITATVATNYQSQGAYLTTAALSNHSHGNPTLALTNISGTTASNSAGLTLSLSAAAPGAGGAVNFSAGTTSGNLDSVVFSNANGVSFGLNGSTVTASAAGGAGANASFWDNCPVLSGTQGTAPGNSQSIAFPIMVPQAVSADYARLFVSRGNNSTSFGTTANTTFSFARHQTINIGLYVQGTGANSTRMETATTISAGQTLQGSFAANANGSQYTVSYNISYPRLGSTSSTQITYASTQTRVDLYSSNLTAFTGNQILDIPLGSVVPASNYWVVAGFSTSGVTGGIAGATAVNVMPSFFLCANQVNISWGAPGVGNNSSVGAAPALGSYSIAGGATQPTIPFSAISTINSYLFPRMQLAAGIPNG